MDQGQINSTVQFATGISVLGLISSMVTGITRAMASSSGMVYLPTTVPTKKKTRISLPWYRTIWGEWRIPNPEPYGEGHYDVVVSEVDSKWVAIVSRKSAAYPETAPDIYVVGGYSNAEKAKHAAEEYIVELEAKHQR